MRRKSTLAHRKVTAEVKAKAEQAKKWMASPEGQRAIERSIERATEVAEKMRDAQCVATTAVTFKFTL